MAGFRPEPTEDPGTVYGLAGSMPKKKKVTFPGQTIDPSDPYSNVQGNRVLGPSDSLHSLMDGISGRRYN